MTMGLGIKEFVICLVIFLSKLECVYSQIPLGIQGLERELLSQYDFGSFGKKIGNTLTSAISPSEEPVKFRRHIKVDKPLLVSSSFVNNKPPSVIINNENVKKSRRTSRRRKVQESSVSALKEGRVNRRGSVRAESKPTGLDKVEKISKRRGNLKRTGKSKNKDLDQTVKPSRKTSRRRSRNNQRINYLGEVAEAVHQIADVAVSQSNPKTKIIATKTPNYYRRINKPKSIEKLVTEQFKRVIDTAHNLNIKTGMEKTPEFRHAKEIMIVSPKTSPDAGNLAYIRFKPLVKPSFDFGVMKGPYDDAHYRQMYNNYDGVLALLGQSAKNKVTPDMNSILSNIALNSEWEIKRL